MNSISVDFQEEDQKTFIKNSKISLPLEKYYSYNYRGFKFYTVDIKNTPEDELDLILKECDAVEKACWNPLEDFSVYARSRDILTYVEHNGKVVAFQIVSYWIMDNYLIFDLDETMVLKECRGNNMARALSMVNSRTVYLRLFKMKNINRIVFMGLTPNFGLIKLLDKMRCLYQFLDNSFKPSRNLMKVHDAYLERKGAFLVHEDYPFFLKSMFPGSLEKKEFRSKKSKRLEKILPPGLDLHHRGDAFLFFASFSKIGVWPIMVVIMFMSLGRGILFNRKLGFLGRNKYDDARNYLEMNGSAILERRQTDRRKSVKNVVNILEGKVNFTERRKCDRRADV